MNQEDNELIQLVLVLPNEILEGMNFLIQYITKFEFCNIDNLKSKVINLLKQKDKGIRGALISYQDDSDHVALRNRILPKVLTPSGSREDRNANPNGMASSASVTTAGFQPLPRTAVGRNRRSRTGNYADRYMSIVMDLENK